MPFPFFSLGLLAYLYSMTHHGVYQLFVYGSLRSGFHHPMYEYISRFFTFLGNAKVKGKLYDMGTFPAGVPDSDGHFIIGELYRIREPHEFSWAIGQLDDYEGVAAEADEVQLYRRELTEVFIDGQMTPAWIYWFCCDVSGKPVIPSGDMLEYLASKKK